MIVASGIAMQFGAKPLFSDVSVKFGGGYRYGLIGANGSGKSTFMKILGGELESSAGTVAIDSNDAGEDQLLRAADLEQKYAEATPRGRPATAARRSPAR